MIKIDAISDLHGYRPELQGGDLLIVAGDLTAKHTEKEHFQVIEWLEDQNYKKIIVIAGNHDTWIEENGCFGLPEKIEYLQDSGTEFEWVKVYGSPWTKTFKGMNPRCKAFTVDTEKELAQKFVGIPDDIDILVTHSPPHGILDGVKLDDGSEFHTGSTALRDLISSQDKFKFPKLKIHIFGHIHEHGGHMQLANGIMFFNASVVNEKYEHVNKPQRIIWDEIE